MMKCCLGVEVMGYEDLSGPIIVPELVCTIM